MFCLVLQERFFIRGGTELYKLEVVDFQALQDTDGVWYLSYKDRLSKNYKVSMNTFQDEHFRKLVLSYDPDVIFTWTTLIEHMPPVSGNTHMFLSPINDSKTNVWFKNNINVGEGTLRKFTQHMAKACDIIGDFTNKTGRVTTISRMCALQVPRSTITRSTRHKCEKTIDRYDDTIAMRHNASQELLRTPYNPLIGEARDYQYYFDKELERYHETSS